jgi:hypothetical protein
VGNNESATTKNEGAELLAFSIAMRLQQYDAGSIAR